MRRGGLSSSSSTTSVLAVTTPVPKREARGARRVLVLGATGHLGRLFVTACRERGLEVAGCSRRGGSDCEALDLTDPTSFERFDDFDVVVNATDTSRVPPVPMAEYALSHGQIFIETTADAAVFRALLELGDGPGTIVLGGGAFPGLSSHLLELVSGDAQRLEFVASWSVLSEAGPGTVQVMLDGLAKPALAVREGAYVEVPPMGELRDVEVAGRRAWALPLGVPDVVLAHDVRRARETTFWAAVRPALPGFVLRLVGWLAKRGLWRVGVVAWATRRWLEVLRHWLLRGVASSLDVELRCDDEVVAHLTMSDAFAAGARHVAVLAERWPAEVTGLAMPHRGVPLETMKAELGDLVRLETHVS